jgi:hypothetical protein
MSDLKISQLTALLGSAAVDTDVLPVVDVSVSTTKKMTLSELVEYIVNTGVFDGAVQALAPSVDFDDDQNVLANAVFS